MTRSATGPDPTVPRGRWALARARRGLRQLAVFVFVGGLVLLAVGDAAGRFRLVPAPVRTAGSGYARSDLMVVVPVPAQRLRVGDVLIIRNSHEAGLYRVEQIVDSEGPQVRFADDAGHVRRLGGTTWRVRLAVPELGVPMHLLGGPLQGVAFVVAGFALVVRAELKRNRSESLTRPGPDVASV